MDFYEELVMFYLTAIRGLLVRPQVPIVLTDQDGKVTWEAYPDFWAVDFEKKQIAVVEVSKNWKVAKNIQHKLSADYRTTVEKHVRQMLKDELPQFPLHWHFIVRVQAMDTLKGLLEKEALVQITEVTSIESIFEIVRKTMP